MGAKSFKRQTLRNKSAVAGIVGSAELPVINAIIVCDSSYNELDDTALNPAGGYAKIVGNNFEAGSIVYFNGGTLTTTFISSRELRIETPVITVGSYNLMLFNLSTGQGAIYLNLNVSNFPTITTSASSPLDTEYETKAISASISATGDGPITYSIVPGLGNLPAGVTLSADGVLSGVTSTVEATTTYTFVVQAKDAQKQDATRQFSLTVNVDVVDWVSPSAGATISAYEYTQFTPTSLNATSRAGYSVTYASNNLPAGVSVSGNTIIGQSNTAGSTNVAIVATSNTTNKSATRYVNVVVNPDAVTWSSPSNNATISAYEYTAFSPTALSATSAAGFNVTYAANQLPAGLSVSGNSIIGTSNVAGTTNTVLTATANTTNRSSTRNVQFVVNPDVVTWSNPTPGSIFTTYEYKPFSNVSLSATSAAGFGVTYAASGLPTGLTLSGSTISGTVNTVGTSNVTLTATANTTNRFADANVQFVVSEDVVTWSNPASNTSLAVDADQPISNITLAATSAAGFNVTYTANGLPTGVTFANGVISGTPTVGGETSNAVLVATAATTGRTSTRYIAWSVNISGDSFWRNITMLLSADSTVAPATFIDDGSTNKFNMTPQGDVRAVDSNPYQGEYYSVEYGGTSNSFISIPHNSGLSIMSGSSNTYVAECWVYWNVVNANISIMDKSGRNTVSHSNWAVELNANKQIRLVWGASGSPGSPGIGILQTTSTPVAGKWYHIAFVKSNADWALFLDGTRITNYTGLNTANDANAGALRIGYGIQGEGNGGYMNGFISNVRVYNGPAGSAPYLATSTSITPPTSPALPGDNVYAVVNQSNRFKDNSTTNATITGGSTTKVAMVSPFVAPVNTYGSAYFNSTGYVTIPDDASLEFANGAFTIEFWIYLPSTTSQSTILAHRATSTTNGPLAIFRPTGTANLVFYAGTGSTGWDIFNGANIGTVKVGQWTHVSVCRSGTTFYSSIDGQAAAFGTTTLSNSIGNGTSQWSIGGDLNGNYTTGYISDLRIVKGSALRTANFTPPTSPLTAVANTSLLTLQNNGPHNNSTFKDDSGFDNIITRNGNPTQGTFGPYGQNWSVNFNRGRLDSVLTGKAPGTGSFTYELFFNITIRDAAIANVAALFSTRGSGGTGGDGFDVQITTNGAVLIGTAGSTLFTSSSGLVNDGVWYHLAIVRNGTTGWTVYLNGSSIGTLNNSTNMASTELYLGVFGGGNQDWFKGYISNFRYTRAAVYTGNFTVPTSPLTVLANTEFLGCQSGMLIDNSANKFAVTQNALNGGTSVQKYSPFSTSTVASPTVATSYNTTTFGGSIYFDGTGDYLQTANNLAHTDITQSDYTVEAWVYNMGAGAERYLFSQRGASSGWEMRINANNSVSTFFTSGTAFTSNTTVAANTWTHVAASRSGTTIRMFLNGKSVLAPGTQANGTSAYAAYGLMLGNSTSAGGGLMLGYIADARVIKGRALYTADFTPPTAPLASTADTTVLFAGRGGVTDASRTLNLETVGDVKSTNSIAPFAGARSYYFDGNGDYLMMSAGSGTIAFGTGDFTIETWVRFATNNGTYNPFIRVNGGGQLDFGYDFSVGQLKYSTSVAVLANAWTPTVGTWYHVALVRSGGNAKIYVNGVNVSGAGGSDTFNHLVTAASTYYRIGGSDFNGTHVLSGYLADFRITKGVARTITAPASTYPTK